MKKLFFSTIVSVFAFQSFSQTTEEQWISMMQSSKATVDNILERTRPADVNLQTYKLQLLDGTAQLPENARQELERNIKHLVKYGEEVVETKGLKYEDESDLVFYSALSPRATVVNDVWNPGANITGREAPLDLTWSEVLHCAGLSLGSEAVNAIVQSGASAWTLSNIKRIFKSVARRMLGPIGVMIAGVTFTVCLIGEAAD